MNRSRAAMLFLREVMTFDLLVGHDGLQMVFDQIDRGLSQILADVFPP